MTAFYDVWDNELARIGEMEHGILQFLIMFGMPSRLHTHCERRVSSIIRTLCVVSSQRNITAANVGLVQVDLDIRLQVHS